MIPQNIFHISDHTPHIDGKVPVNRIIYSAFKRYELEKESFGFSLKMPVLGSEKYIIGNKLYTVGPGEYFLAHNGQTIGYELKHHHPVKGICFFLDESLIRKSMNSCVGNEFHLSESSHQEPMNELSYGKFLFEKGPFLDFMQQLVRNKPEDFYHEETEQLFYELGLAIGSQLFLHQQRKRNIVVKKKSTQDEIYARLQIARQFLHDQMHLPFNLKAVAECASFSEFHFIRNFKSCFGISPYRYLTRIRIEKSKELLHNSNYRLAEIAAICGFNDEFMFSKIFKTQTGLPPGSYRRSDVKKNFL